MPDDPVSDSIPGVASAATRTAVFSSALQTNPQRSAQRSLTMMLKGLPAHGELSPNFGDGRAGQAAAVVG